MTEHNVHIISVRQQTTSLYFRAHGSPLRKWPKLEYCSGKKLVKQKTKTYNADQMFIWEMAIRQL